MEGIVQFSYSILDDVLGLCDGTLQQSKLLLQKLLLQLLLLTRLHAHTHINTHCYIDINRNQTVDFCSRTSHATHLYLDILGKSTAHFSTYSKII